MKEIVAIGIVKFPFLFLKQTNQFFSKNEVKLKKGCMIHITKIGSRFHQVSYQSKTLYVKANRVNIILKNAYSHDDFLHDIGKILNFSDSKLFWENTITLSSSQNENHRLVTPVKQFLNSLGYDSLGDDDSSSNPVYNEQLKQAVKDYQSFFLRLSKKRQDGTLKAQGPTWKSLIHFSLN